MPAGQAGWPEWDAPRHTYHLQHEPEQLQGSASSIDAADPVHHIFDANASNDAPGCLAERKVNTSPTAFVRYLVAAVT